MLHLTLLSAYSWFFAQELPPGNAGETSGWIEFDPVSIKCFAPYTISPASWVRSLSKWEITMSWFIFWEIFRNRVIGPGFARLFFYCLSLFKFPYTWLRSGIWRVTEKACSKFIKCREIITGGVGHPEQLDSVKYSVLRKILILLPNSHNCYKRPNHWVNW